MRIVHLSTSDTLGGGSLAAHAIHRGLISRGIGSRMVVRSKGTQDQAVFLQNIGPKRFRDYASRFFVRFKNKKTYGTGKSLTHQPFSYLSGTESRYSFGPETLLPADLIQINWVSDFIDWQSFFSRRPPVPLVWRIADMSPFTGLCHYSNGCERFKEKCHHCPQAVDAGVKDISEPSFKLKQELLGRLDDCDLTLICQSEWMAGLVAASPILGRFRRYVIHNGVNRDYFFPIEKRLAKQSLGLDLDRPCVLLYGFSPEPRKGFDDLLAEIRRRQIEKHYFLVLGPKPWSVLQDEGWRTVQSVHDRRLLRLIYSSCDLMVFPSIQDNCPNAVIESIACGTPVLAFDGTGTEEIITNSDAGWTTPCRDFGRLVDRILELVDDREELISRQHKCIPGIKSGFTFEAMLDQYVGVYRAVLNYAK